jgi:hypothetical protein
VAPRIGAAGVNHFFDRAKVERLAAGWDLPGLEEFEEGRLPGARHEPVSTRARNRA